MLVRQRSLLELSIEELDRELIARGAQIPGDAQFKFKDTNGTLGWHAIMAQIKDLYDTASSPKQTLSHISTRELVETLIHKIQENNDIRGIWGKDYRLDFYAITDKQIKKNADSTAAICMKKDLIDDKNGFSTLKHKNYGRTFNLCDCEPFCRQPTAAGRLCTGFLVKEDVVATAGHCACEKNVTDLRIVFGFKMLGPSTPVTWIPHENIYKGIKIIRRAYNRTNRSDWALVKLDRKVTDHPVVKLSENAIYLNQPVYIFGYPCGLPLKCAAGAQVRGITDTSFAADLDVYCGNSGSPVFDNETHEVIGMVVRGDNRDFRLVENCWMSIIYSRADKCSKEPQCTRVSEFIEYCR